MPHKKHIINGQEAPSVTQVLDVLGKPGLLYWYGTHGTQECERIKQESADFGTTVHDAINAILTNTELPKLIKRQEAIVEEFKKWADTRALHVVETETPLENHEDIYGGTPDAIVRFGESKELFVVDWKTSNRIYDTHALQLAGYARAYNLTHGLTWANGVNSGYIVRFEKAVDKKPVEPKLASNLEALYEEFKHLRIMYDFVHKKGKWKGKKIWTN